jgi:plastocyanin
MDEDKLTNILYDIISVQSFQVHQFRNYLGPHGLLPSDGYDSDGPVDCIPSPTNICMSMNFFASETGYYEFKGHVGSSPEITVKIGETITFDQSDPSNWYHPVGFAYEPDGAHGSTWGGEELPEVEGAGELQYKIDGANPTCADAGDTGLDCYEPEFFFPREEWMSKKYTAELTVTQAVADASHGGVIYYFCHIHSKMSGKIRILNADGTEFSPMDSPMELDLYSVHDVTPVDGVCGTSGLEPYSFGQEHACAERYICGDLDTDFEKCLDAMNCEMKTNMHRHTTADQSNKVAVFMQQMIPHHKNAINMAKLLLKQVSEADITAAMDEDKLTNILYDIISVQSFQVHQFRNYLGPLDLLTGVTVATAPPTPAPPVPPTPAPTIADTDAPADEEATVEPEVL